MSLVTFDELGRLSLPRGIESQLTDEEWSTLQVVMDTFTPELSRNQCNKIIRSHPQLNEEKASNFLRSPASSWVSREYVDLKLSNLSKKKLSDLKTVLRYLNSSTASLFITGHLSPFTQLSPEQRELVVQKWAISNLTTFRVLFNSLGNLSVGVTYAHPTFGKEFIYWAASGYPGADPLRDTKKLALTLDEYQFLNVPAQGVTLEYDVVVIGTGAGGGVVAGRLASAGLKVLVLEKGGFYNMDQLPLTEAESYHHLYEGNGSIISEDSGASFIAGSTFGGGTFVNWSASLAPPHSVREEWSRQHGLPFFESSAFQRHIDAVSKRIGVSDQYVQHNVANQAMIVGCKRLGYSVSVIPQNTAGRHHDCGWCTFGCANGGKQSTAVTWLQDAQKHGAHFAVNCRVDQVIVKNGRAEGVIAHINGAPIVVKAKRVVVSAGAFNSPLLLQRSGLKNKNIGRNLYIHPVYFVSGYFPEHQIDQFNGSIMTTITGAADCRQGTGYGAKLEISAGHPALGAFCLGWRSGESHKTRMIRIRNQVTAVVLIRDKDSVARVFADKETQKPCIEFTLGKFDAESGVEGIQAAVKILVAAGAKEVDVPFPNINPFVSSHSDLPQEDDQLFPDVDLKNSDKLNQFLNEIASKKVRQHVPLVASAHQMGSCRMGISSKTSVVNPKGETWEAKGLYVADGSVFPTPSGVNPMITIQSVAYSIAEFIKEDLLRVKGSKL
ncbi:hypothetical protein K7432_007775 [Basidiobolus ranarum]|uniref:Long-chain-alcohol oxidase n=1 Tax=Basidiobolus ranarum TaxID=34480 RepID=A0ABR2W0J9_9FUNG